MAFNSSSFNGSPLKLCRIFFQFVLADETFVLRVKHSERSDDHVFGISARQPVTEQREKGGEIDGTGRFVDHFGKHVVGRDLTHGRVKILQISLVDDTVLVLIHDLKGLLEFLDRPLIERLHGVRLRALLRRCLLRFRCHIDECYV